MSRMRGWIRMLPLLVLFATAPAQDVPEEPPERGPSDDEVEEILEGLRFGPYRHLYETREKRALSTRVRKLFADLQGLHYRCPRCKGSGEITVTIREGYWLDEFTWVEPVFVNKTCPRCEGPGKLFNESLALRFFRSPDKYATVTCDGHAIAFLELDGKDCGEELLRRGLARLHPKHMHRRFGTCRSAETEAKEAKVGIWAE